MRLERLELKDFKCFPSLKMTFDKPINLIFGQNASGKTTISQAIELALTGRCNGTTMDFRARRALTRNGAEEFTVYLTLVTGNGHPTGKLSPVEIIQKNDTKQSHPKPDAILEQLKTNRDIMAALFDTRHFLNAHPDEQKKILFDLLDIRVDQSNLRQRLCKWMKNHPEVLGRYGLQPDDDLLSCLDAVPRTLEEGYQQAFEERKLIKRELKLLNLPETFPQGLTAEELQSQIEQGQMELSDLYTRIGEARGMILGERKQLAREISDISSQILRLQQESKGFELQRESHALKQLEDKKESHTNEIMSLHENLNDLLHDLASLQAMAREEESHLSRFKDFDGSCPLLADILEEKIACRTEEILEAISGIQTAPQETRLTEKIEATQKEIETLQEQIKSQEAALISLEGAISFHKSRLGRFESNQQKIVELQRKREQAEEILTSLDESKINEAENLKARIKELECQIEKDKSQLAYLQQDEKKRFLENKLNKLEVLTLAFSPKGIMEDLLAGGLSYLLANANQLMHRLSGGRYTIDITGEEGFHIYLCDHVKKAKTEINLTSNSEQFRVGIVLQAVLSELAGLRFMLIDGVDILDQQNKGFFFRFLGMIAPRFDQVIAFCTIGQHYPKNPGLRYIDFWVIEDEAVNKLTAMEKAAA